jgi:hypothetical protein
MLWAFFDLNDIDLRWGCFCVGALVNGTVFLTSCFAGVFALWCFASG